MSISNTQRSAGPFSGDGVTVALPFTFKVFEAADLVVEQTSAAGVRSVLTLGGHYTVTLNADQNVSPGGLVTLAAPLEVGASASVTSDVAATQPLQIRNGGPFLPGAIEDALDRATVLIQQYAQTGSAQALRVPEVGGVDQLPAVADRALRVLAFNASGQPVAIPGVDAGSAAALALDLASSSSASKGAGMVGYGGTAVSYPAGTVGAALRKFDPAMPPWNADRTGSVDATAAINACALAAGANSRLEFSPGTYRITGKLTKTHNFQWWVCYGVTFDFRPLASGTCLEVKSATAGQSVWGGGVFGAYFTSPDSTYVKTAIEVFDARIHALHDIVITGTVSRGGNNFWSDNTSASIGLRVRGRELIECARFYISADQPLRLSPSPNTSIVGIDHTTFHHFTLLAHENAAVLVDDGTCITQSGFTGRLSVNLAREAIKWVDTSGTVASAGVFIENLRAEQAESHTYPVIDIRMLGAATLQSLSIAGGFCNQTGPYLRGVRLVSFDDWFHGEPAVVALNADSTVEGIDADNCFWQATATATLTGQRITFAVPQIPNTGPLPATFRMEPAANTKRNMVIGGAVAQQPVTVANDATLLLENNLGGVLAITDDRGLGAMFVVHGTNGVAELVSTTTSAAYFSNTAATASKTNVHWTGTTYAIQNKTGASRNYRFALLGSYGAF